MMSCSDDKTTTSETVSVQSVEETSTQKAIAEDVNVDKFKELVESGNGLILDVRTPGEVAEGHIENATHIDIFDTQFKAKVAELDKAKPVYVYCRSGGRSGRAMDLMKAIGFKTVYNLEGGIGAWNNAGNKTVK